MPKPNYITKHDTSGEFHNFRRDDGYGLTALYGYEHEPEGSVEIHEWNPDLSIIPGTERHAPESEVDAIATEFLTRDGHQQVEDDL